MQWKLPVYLNIRQKVVLGLSLCMMVFGAIGAMSYRYLKEIELKQHFVEVADDLNNAILEARRYEKNYLLYGSVEDLQENSKYVQEALDVLRKVQPGIKDFKGAPLLERLGQEIAVYATLMERMSGASRDRQTPDPQVEEQLREHGKNLVGLTQQLVSFERQRILNIIRTLKAQLISALGIFLGLGGFLIAIVARKIIRPLRVIEKTTNRIAQGDFRPIPVLDTRDETQRVVEAFNRMVGELEKRQDQLLQAKKLSSLGTLTSGIAHQLNNPLNNISTSCQILLEEMAQSASDFHRRMLANIEQEVHRARDIVRGLLEFSRVKEFCMAPVPLVQVVDRSVKLMSSQIPPGVELTIDVPGSISLNLDSQRMQQVFLNLIENAVHAIKTLPGQIRIAARQEATSGNVLITVEDTGTGIPEKDLGRVFDPFFSTKEVGVGTGLGLSIVYGIIQKHNGSIGIESKEGEGTRFLLRFPASSTCAALTE
ncbi:MAG: sensor histidine kinase [Syntrophobacteraceae bacterium]